MVAPAASFLRDSLSLASPSIPSPNFRFLRKVDKDLMRLGAQAEVYCLKASGLCHPFGASPRFARHYSLTLIHGHLCS